MIRLEWVKSALYRSLRFLPSDQPMILPETIASLLLCAKNLPDLSGALL
ncbi:MAG: hypothetical protein ACLURV_00655 [Gallintestinimicrobium sp.]